MPAVREFNLRLAAGGVEPRYRFPEQALPEWLPKTNGARLFQECFLAPEEQAVRGGYILKHQEFSFGGEARSIGYYHSPVSEGIVNRAYAGLGLQMLRSALKAQPLLFALGMGGYDGPLPRMLKLLGWTLWSVPFYFRVARPYRFLRRMRALRSGTARRMAMDVAALTGAGWAAIKAFQGLRARGSVGSEVRIEPVSEFSSWADRLWDSCQARYAMAAVRDSRSLALLYPPQNERFIRLKVTRGGELLGWAVALDTTMRDDQYFGDLRVGSIVDCLALPERAGAVVAAASRVIEERGADLLISNQAHEAWSRGFRDAGFLEGPSNFIFAASPKLAGLLQPLDSNRARVHLTRGDGDGPIHL